MTIVFMLGAFVMVLLFSCYYMLRIYIYIYIIFNHIHDVNVLKTLLGKNFDMKYLGASNKILGMEFPRIFMLENYGSL